MKTIIYRDARGEWRWRIVARNGRIVADSGEGYKTAAGALRAWHRFGDGFLFIGRPEVRK